jgi:flagellar basal-body rod protein FlgF
MDNASYIALSRQLTLRRQLDITANNMANMNTTGFKVEELIVRAEPGRPAYNDPIKYPANFAYDQGMGRDFSQGSLNKTGNDLDLAVDGEDRFFVLAGPDGPVYTRNGAFTLNDQGVIQSQMGLSLTSDGGQIVIDTTKVAPTIAEDGTISQGGEQVGRIAVVRISNLSALEKIGDNNYKLGAGATAQPATNAKISQGFLEGSNVNAIKEVTRLVEINRQYTSVTNLINQNNDLNRSAVERLGRVA